jgi:outer membrane lipoprotein carrier protein
MFLSLWLAIPFYGLAGAPDAPPDVQAIAKRVDDHYNRLRTLQSEFTEVYRGAGMERTESGTLWLKKPGKMRWEYRSPREKLFISDGKYAWFYLPGDRQARRTEVRKLEDLRSPLAFLLGKSHLQRELEGLSWAPDISPSEPGNVVLRGVPRALENRVTQVLLEITSQSQIRRILVEEGDGSTTDYVFRQIEEDQALSDARFRFIPPPGVETIDGDLGQ